MVSLETRKLKHGITRCSILGLTFLILLLLPPLASGEQQNSVILCTTFPIYQITRNVVGKRPGVQVELMLPAALGCPHDYTLTPQDMQKLARAKVLVVNGLGLEEFLETRVRDVNSTLVIVDSSAGLRDLLYYNLDHHHQNAVNPHVFVSPRMSRELALNIAKGLSAFDAQGGDTYSENARAYAQRMNKLADEFVLLARQIKSKPIVTQHDVFDYLARDMGLEIAAVVQTHPGQEPSAAEMLGLIHSIRQQRAAAVFVEPQYSAAIGKTLARETGIPLATLDPVATGPKDAPLDYYDSVMKKNIEVLKRTLSEN